MKADTVEQLISQIESAWPIHADLDALSLHVVSASGGQREPTMLSAIRIDLHVWGQPTVVEGRPLPDGSPRQRRVDHHKHLYTMLGQDALDLIQRGGALLRGMVDHPPHDPRHTDPTHRDYDASKVDHAYASMFLAHRRAFDAAHAAVDNNAIPRALSSATDWRRVYRRVARQPPTL